MVKGRANKEKLIITLKMAYPAGVSYNTNILLNTFNSEKMNICNSRKFEIND